MKFMDKNTVFRAEGGELVFWYYTRKGRRNKDELITSVFLKEEDLYPGKPYVHFLWEGEIIKIESKYIKVKEVIANY